MKSRGCYLFVFDGFSDWEPSLVTAGLMQYTDVDVKTFSLDGKPVRSMGNLNIKPDMGLNDVDVKNVDALILPGGLAWERGGNTEVRNLIDTLLLHRKVVAAICGATVFLGAHGYLNGIQHTSNHLYFLKQSRGMYNGEDWYVNKPCVVTSNIITANGTAMVDFAIEVFTALNVMDNEGLNFWLQFFPKSVMPNVSVDAFAHNI